MQPHDPTPRSSRKRCCITRMLVCAFLVSAAVGGISAWHWLASLRSIDQAVLEKRVEIAEKRKARQRAAIEKERTERKAKRDRTDASDMAERTAWTRVIEASSSTMRRGGATPAELMFRLAGYRPSAEVTEGDVDFWSFQRLSHAEPPLVDDRSWCRNPIDRFVLARLEAAGLAPNRVASRQVLGRRLWFDLTGLPPTAEEITAFVEADEPEAYQRLVDRLLDDPGFGERWGRVWLDLARYADSNGYEEDEFRPHAYPYRDFVIWAMNADLPFDLFTRWQIAGDEMAGDNPMAVAATGFLTAAPLNTFIPQESERMDELDDIASTIGGAMLGLTVGCARCHDHKYDPIPTSEYYGLVAIFAETSRDRSYLTADRGKEYRRWFDPVDERRQEIKKMLKARIKEDNISGLDYFTDEEKDLLRQPIDPDNTEQDRLISLCERCLMITDEQLSDDLEPLPEDRERYDQLKSELDDLESALPARPPVGLTLTGSAVSKTPILAGGDLKRKQHEVGPGFLSAVTVGRPAWDDDTWKAWAGVAGSDDTPKPRTALANWMTDVDRGAGSLLARVVVNRLWQHHFGEGLVRTSSDFGSKGEPPSHPQLLEWLAGELVDHEWSLKHIHRLIVTSATYRQATTSTAEKRRVDPENRLLGRRVPRRITAEMMRDAMLFAAGNLNHDMYGPGIKPPIPRDAVYNTQKTPEETWPSDYEADRPALWRRSIYVMLKRTIPVPMLRLFDAPDGSFSCGRRKVTTVPTQALALWNAPFVIAQSERLAERIVGVAATREDQIQQLFMLTVSRAPTKQEIATSVEFLRRGGGADTPEQQQKRLAALGHVLFMSNEFFYID